MLFNSVYVTMFDKFKIQTGLQHVSATQLHYPTRNCVDNMWEVICFPLNYLSFLQTLPCGHTHCCQLSFFQFLFLESIYLSPCFMLSSHPKFLQWLHKLKSLLLRTLSCQKFSLKLSLDRFEYSHACFSNCQKL